MSRHTANPKPLSPADRKAKLDGLVRSGKVSQRAAELVDFRQPTQKERSYADALGARLRGRKAA